MGELRFDWNSISTPDNKFVWASYPYKPLIGDYKTCEASLHEDQPSQNAQWLELIYTSKDTNPAQEEITLMRMASLSCNKCHEAMMRSYVPDQT